MNLAQAIALLSLLFSFLSCAKGDEPPAYPTKVYVSVHSNKIGAIKEREGQFGFDIYFHFTWRDDRKAELANLTGTYDKDIYWYPNPEIMNSAVDYDPEIGCYFGDTEGLVHLQGPTAGEMQGTWIYCTSRMRLTLDADLLLKAFPWDTQRAFLTVESGSTPREGLVWAPTGVTNLLPNNDPNAVGGWKILSTGSEIGTHHYTTFAATYSTLTYWLVLERVPEYFINRYIWGVVFLVSMALLVLFVPGHEPDRLGFVQSSFLGIVSWQFILVSSTPVTGYNTKLDNFMLIAMVTVFSVYFWNSLRIGFFDWVSKLHDQVLLGDGGVSSSGGDKSASPAAEGKPSLSLPAEVNPGLSLKSVSEVEVGIYLPPSGDSPSTAAATPSKAAAKGRSRVWRYLCLKCGEEDLHWVIDSMVGILLSLAFAVACAVLLTSKTSD